MNKNKIIKPWFTQEVKILAQEKREAYLKYSNAISMQEFKKYKEIRNRIKRIKTIKEEY
jgi:hypothetical protein